MSNFYDANESPGGFHRSPSGGASDRKDGGRKKDTQMRPVSVKQLLDSVPAANSTFTIDGIAVTQVTLIATIVEIQVQSTYVYYRLDDGTGEIKACKYHDQDDSNQAADFRENTYVRIYGSPAIFQNEKSVTVYSMSPVTDMNEITMHHLDIIHSHLLLTRGPAPQGMSGGASMSVSAPASYGGAGTTYGSALNDAVMAIFARDSQSEKGTSLQTVVRQLPNFSLKEIRNAIEQLSSEGQLYSTADEEHFRITTQ